MFNNTRKVLDEFEKTYNNLDHGGRFPTKDEEDILLYFNMHLAKALMQDEYIGAESVSKIILAAKNLSSEITVKVE
jgi:hypothetical protein